MPLHSNADEELALKLEEIHEETIRKELDTLIDKVKKPKDQSVDNAMAQKIRCDISNMKEYLNALITLETDHRLLVAQIVTLNKRKYEEFSKAAENQLEALAKNRRENTLVVNQAQQLEDEIQRMEEEFVSKDWEKAVKVRKVPVPKAPEYLNVKLPREPRYPTLKKPDANGVYPNEPQYPKLKTPGLFNKKKVQEENAQLIARHESAVAAYRHACEKENLQRLSQYEEAMIAYRQECVLIEENKRKNEAMEAEYQLKLQKYKDSAAQRQEKALAEAMQMKEDARAELERKISEIRQQIVALPTSENTPKIQLQIGQFFDEQIDVAKQQLKEITEELNRLYSINVLYPTYRELVAESSFYEYFSSGRCDTLEGAHGAYNLFEAECRSDVVARIIRTLGEVKQGQVILYRQMIQNQELLKDIDNALEKAIPHIRKINGERMSAYLEEKRSKGNAASESEKASSKETAVEKYFRLSSDCEARVKKSIAQAKQVAI